jgi:hypothetical protein
VIRCSGRSAFGATTIAAAAPRKTLGSRRLGSVGDPSAEMKLSLLVSAVGRLNTASVAGSRQPMSTIRAASASAVEKT